MRPLLLTLLLAACGGDKDTSTPTDTHGHGDDSAAGTDDSSAGTDDSSATTPTGEDLYTTHCAACHGADAAGTANGPDLVRELHHTDDDIIRVILNGKGDMAPVAITEEEAQLIVDYLRATFGT